MAIAGVAGGNVCRCICGDVPQEIPRVSSRCKGKEELASFTEPFNANSALIVLIYNLWILPVNHSWLGFSRIM